MADETEKEKKTHLLKQRDLYWRENSAGYTAHLCEAGTYTQKEAERIQRGNRTPPDRAIPITREHIIELEELSWKVRDKLKEFREVVD